MNNNEFSFESIFAAGMGIPTDNTVVAQSEERFDGNFDTVFAEISRSEEDIQFLETYGSMEDFNTKAKLNMLSKINKAYGKCNRGIENYCRSLESETEGTSAVKEDEKSAEEGKSVDPKKVENKKNWLKSVLTALGNFFRNIWRAIVNFFKNLSVRVKTFITKVQAKSNINKKNKDTDKAQKKGEAVETPMTKEDAEKLSKFVDETYKAVVKIQSTVNKISASNDKIVKAIENRDNINEEYTNSIKITSSLLKTLASLGNVILISSNKIFVNITNVRVVGMSNVSKFLSAFDKINSAFTSFCTNVIKGNYTTTHIISAPLQAMISVIFDDIKVPVSTSQDNFKLEEFNKVKPMIDEKINSIKENNSDVIKSIGTKLFGVKFINDKAFEKKPESK